MAILNGEVELDSITIYINDMKKIELNIFGDNLKHFYFNLNPHNKYLSSYEKNFGGIYVRYYPYKDRGMLEIKFNIPKLIYGNNIESVYCFNPMRLFNELSRRLAPMINLKNTPSILHWKVSKVEINLNYKNSTLIINNLHDVIKKISYTKHFKREKTRYRDGGQTIYFYNRKNNKNSTLIIKVYFKLRQVSNTSNNNVENKLFNGYDSLSSENYEILRFEITVNRKEILKQFKLKDYVPKSRNETLYSDIGTFHQVMDYNYQMLMLDYMINELHLDKLIATKKELISIINNSNELDNNEKMTAKHVILYLNGDYHKTKPKLKEIEKYKNYVLNKGYHYIYSSDITIGPIILDVIADNLNKYKEAIGGFNYGNRYLSKYKPV